MEENKNLDTGKNTRGFIKEIFQWINAVLLALVLALLIRGLIFEPVMVKGDSMQDTLHDGQRLLVYKLGYYFSPPQRGDIVVLQYQAGFFQNVPSLDDSPFFRKLFPDFKEINYIKRAIGIPGDTVDIKNGEVYVNGNQLAETYIKGDTQSLGMTFPLQVPENKVFVLGDNRQHSSDSRVIGLVKITKLKGKAVFRIYPFDLFGGIK